MILAVQFPVSMIHHSPILLTLVVSKIYILRDAAHPRRRGQFIPQTPIVLSIMFTMPHPDREGFIEVLESSILILLNQLGDISHVLVRQFHIDITVLIGRTFVRFEFPTDLFFGFVHCFGSDYCLSTSIAVEPGIGVLLFDVLADTKLREHDSFERDLVRVPILVS